MGLAVTATWALGFFAWTGGSAPLDGLVLVEKMGLPPLGTAVTKVPLCTAPTGGPPTPPLAAAAVPTTVWGANNLSWIA